MAKAKDDAPLLTLVERWLIFVACIAPAEQFEARPQSQQVKLIVSAIEALGTLTAREQRVLTLRFGLDGGDEGRQRTLEEVGASFNVTRERIRQIEAKALRKLRVASHWDPDWKPQLGPSEFGPDGFVYDKK